jgi:hypothetical protein
LIELLINSGEEINVETRDVQGAQADTQMARAMRDQELLFQMLDDLKLRFMAREREWEHDFAKELKKYSKEFLMRGNESEEEEEGSKSKSMRRKAAAMRVNIIAQLNESLQDANITPDDVQNMLIRDRAERNRTEVMRKYKSSKTFKRLSL